MKLHIPSRLRAAVVPCLTMVTSFVPTLASGALSGVFGCGVLTWSLAPQVQAGSLTPNTSEYNGTTYSGTVFTYNAAGKTGTQTLHTAVLSYGGGVNNFNCNDAQTVDGVASTKGWHVFASNQTCSYGQTLRLTGATADIFLNSTFTPYTLGGLITDTGNYTYTVGRSSGDCNIEFLANDDSGFNMDIGANTVVKTGTGGNITVMTGGMWNIAQGKTLTLTSAAAINIQRDVDVRITGGGTVRFNGATNLSEGGTLTIEDGTTLQFTRTIVSDGTLEFGQNTSLSIDSLLGLEYEGTYSDSLIPGDNANGYATGSYIVIRSTTETASTSVTGLTTATIAGTSYGLTESNGRYVVTLDGTEGFYYITEGELEYGAADNSMASEDTSAIVLNGGTLKITSGTPLNKNVEVLSDSTLYIDKGVEVNRTTTTTSITENGGHVYLAGAGTYTITTASTVYVGADWQGLVKLQNVTANGLNLNNYGPRIELSGLFGNTTGYLLTGIQTFTPDIHLTNGTYDAAIFLRNGNNNDSHTFSGKITGDGDIVRNTSTGTNRTLKFTGDVSEWTGKYTSSYAHATSSTTLVFSDNATTIFAGVEATANSIVNVAIDNSETVNFGGSKDAEDAEPGKIAINKAAGGTLTTSGAGAKNFLGTVEAKKLVTSGGEASFKQGATFDSATLSNNSANPGTVKNVTIDATHLTGAGTDVETLGKMVSLDVTFAAAGTGTVSVSNVVMQDVTLNATNRTVSYTNVKAVAATTGGAASPTLYAAALSDTTQTLTATAVQSGGNASGTLTIDLTGTLLNEHRGDNLKWTFLDGVNLGEGFKVELGYILKGMVSEVLPENGLPKVSLTVGNGDSIPLTLDNISNITTAENGLLAAYTGSAVNVTLTVTNLPEPTTATLSVLALAALAARRRRK